MPHLEDAIDTIREKRFSIRGTPGLQPADGTGQGQGSWVNLWIIHGWSGIDRGLGHDGTIIDPQDVKTPILTTGANYGCWLAGHLNGNDLRCIPNGLVLIPGLGIPPRHGMIPYIMLVDLRDPFLMTIAGVYRNDGR